LPIGIKNILIANGFSNKFVTSKIHDKDIESIEKFAQEISPDLIEEKKYEKYYGTFKNNVKKFKNINWLQKKFVLYF